MCSVGIYPLRVVLCASYAAISHSRLVAMHPGFYLGLGFPVGSSACQSVDDGGVGGRKRSCGILLRMRTATVILEQYDGPGNLKGVHVSYIYRSHSGIPSRSVIASYF